MFRVRSKFESPKDLAFLILAISTLIFCVVLKQYALAAVFLCVCLKSLKSKSRSAVLLDSDALIDGRALDLCEFFDWTIVIHHSDLEKIRQLSNDSTYQKRITRLLEKLQEIRQKQDVFIVEDLVKTPLELAKLARKYSCTVVTINFKLTAYLRKQRIRTLNVNQLASLLVKNIVIGDQFKIVIEKVGREVDQGVGYLEDGTVVIVEDARLDIGKQIEILVTNTLNQKQGRIVFARKK
jgi:uncharacterized protein YacL